MRLLRFETYRAMPWKNGGGTTQEIAVFPEGSSAGAFLWRISLATVSVSGPFSRFAGVDRSLSCLAGGGIRLTFADGRGAVLRPGADPFAFAGEDEIHADCLDGETVDLNVMTRRPAWRHSLTRVMIKDQCTLAPEGDDGAIFLGGPARLVTGDQRWEARTFDCLLTDGDRTPIHVLPANRLEIFVISFRRA
ncbi:hypothetical protein SAMN02745157_2684 [Kaistia soli DSM 19436]|uniref:HutD protein n=1 Tax=Kaistia soli DSM 19436 TaxID=1122133 RepID=A0A1M5DHL2_9HYPH|nr:HutD family protein [Kaistia soli]SHF66406.1 hypothetical protein SAMN02745157_2684 [Kaistia soli DSM 19436]